MSAPATPLSASPPSTPPCDLCPPYDQPGHDTRHHELVRAHDGCGGCGGVKEPGRDACFACERRGISPFKRRRR